MTNTTRTDCHSPKTINPADYTYERAMLTCIPAEFNGSSDKFFAEFRTELQRDFDWVRAEGWQGGNFAAKTTCDHCGAAFIYGSAFRHVPTGEVIVVGWECAENTMTCTDRVALDQKRLRNRLATMRETLRRTTEAAVKVAAVFAAYPGLEDALATDHYIVKDIAGRLEQWGSVSPKQVALVRKLAAEANAPKTSKADEPKWQAVTVGRREVSGVVLTAKWKETQYGDTLKMLVHLDGDQKVWGTVPANIERTLDDSSSLRGQRVSFTATFERSRDDDTFGFYKRPTKATVAVAG